MTRILRETYYKANKTHTCDFCLRPITPAMYYKATVVEDSPSVYTIKTCSRCEDYVSEFFRYITRDHPGEVVEYDFDDFRQFMREMHPNVAKRWWANQGTF